MVVREEEGSFDLENLIGYLSDELLATDLGGTPRLVRLYGWYSIDDMKALGEFFARVPAGDVIVDARNFGGAGTILKPEFVAFDRRRARTVWVAGKDNARELAGAHGVLEAHIVATLEEARERLR